MVDPHGGLVDVRFERVVGVRERRDGKVLRRRGHEQERGGKKDLTEHLWLNAGVAGEKVEEWRDGRRGGSVSVHEALMKAVDPHRTAVEKLRPPTHRSVVHKPSRLRL